MPIPAETNLALLDGRYLQLSDVSTQTVTGPVTFTGAVVLGTGGSLQIPTGAGLNKVLTSDATGVATWQTPSAGVSSVTNSDGTLTISPTTGAVVASLALGAGNTWTGLQSFRPTGAYAGLEVAAENGDSNIPNACISLLNSSGGMLGIISASGISSSENGVIQIGFWESSTSSMKWGITISDTSNTGTGPAVSVCNTTYPTTLNDGVGNMTVNKKLTAGTAVLAGTYLQSSSGGLLTDGGGAAPTAVAVPASGTAYIIGSRNSVVTSSGGTVTGIAINGVATGLTSGTFYLKINDTITWTYTAAPTVYIMGA